MLNHTFLFEVIWKILLFLEKDWTASGLNISVETAEYIIVARGVRVHRCSNFWTGTDGFNWVVHQVTSCPILMTKILIAVNKHLDFDRLFRSLKCRIRAIIEQNEILRVYISFLKIESCFIVNQLVKVSWRLYDYFWNRGWYLT